MGNCLQIALVLLVALLTSEAGAAERFGRLYDISGDATLTRNGKREPLTRGKDLLAPILEGDELSVKGIGRLLVVSTRGNTGYELLSGASAKIRNGRMERIGGKVTTLQGLLAVPSDKELKGAPGALVMRGSRQCVKIISPQNENLIATSAELRWSTNCSEVESVKIEVREDSPHSLQERPLYAARTEHKPLQLPPGTLKHGTDYQWTIDAGPGLGKATAFFRVLDKKTSTDLVSRIGGMQYYGEDLSKQLSYIFFLQENGLHSIAEREISILKEQQGWNSHMNETLKSRP